MNRKRTLYALIAVVWLTILAAPIAGAASQPRILQRRLDPDARQLTLYARHADGAAVSGVQIGGVKVEDAEIASNASETTLVTWILLDSSASMPQDVRVKASDLLTALLGERGRGETYNFCAFSDRLNVKLRDSDSFTDLKKRIDDISYDAPRSAPVDALHEVLTEESRRTGPEFVRIVIISAGGDASGALPERLVSNIPVYVIGCDNGDNAESLSQLYALSERTYARHWEISEIGASDIAKIMRWEEIPLKATLTIPESLRAGTALEIEVTFSDGSSAHDALSAEDAAGIIGDAAQQSADNTAQSDAEANAESDAQADAKSDAQADAESDADDAAQQSAAENGSGVPADAVALFALLILGLAVGVFLILRRGIGRDAYPFPVPGRGGTRRFSASGDNDATVANFPTLCLQDLRNPERRFSVSLRNRVTIGRASDNVLYLNYDKSISRRHCEIYFQNHRLWIQDSNSSGGTYLGGERIANARALPNGAVIRLGHVSYKVELQETPLP